MRAIINSGESVLYKGTIISSENIQDLPTEAELALESGNNDIIATTKETLENDLARLQKQLAMLQEEVSNPEAVAPSANDADVKKGRPRTS